MRALARIAAPRNGIPLTITVPSATISAYGFLSPIAPVSSGSVRWSSSSSSSSRWKQRQATDFYAREAKVYGLKSRAAFKLLEMDSKYKLFKRGQTIIDLGYAPGSWSQVAFERTKPNGRVIGIDIIPVQPPKGVTTIQGNFLSPNVRQLVKDYLVEFAQRQSPSVPEVEPSEEGEPIITERQSYIDTERAESVESEHLEENDGRLVDVVLSDMSAPWEQTTGFSSRTLSNPYFRMMNASGMSFRDHAGSMDLCLAALQFASDTLKSGGHFVCKFYQGAEDKDLELKLKKMFAKVHREKPDSSRSESRESFFVALRRKGEVTLTL
ncbi:23S ribosomal RNA methyltransferase [Annulohypoxylon truncatum]|uniref:23S ribosomal RNA methyltransferase n=1 Tax=Annulohypoxylon truncatum TaxID=327061 RepID=UPI0020071EBE|nr:23S ribosomal RNA methyltransferase [Annulohypoxylon truncatum]KAI1211659.1 23S ribosomal RNA methyltransferase [Annulohypoxylon truncatum]